MKLPLRFLSRRAVPRLLALVAVIYATVVFRLESALEEHRTNNSDKTNEDYPPVPRRVERTILSSPVDTGLVRSKSGHYLWEEANTVLPGWMLDYFRWHSQERQRLASDRNNWSNHRFLILTCHKKSRKCGGIADRLSPLAFLLRLAAQSKRLFLIHWGRPAALEEFLLPPVGGLDWRVPDWLLDNLLRDSAFATVETDLLRLMNNATLSTVRCRFQSHDHGSDYYNKHRAANEPTMEQVTRDTWRILFTPSPPVAERIEKVMSDHNMAPGHYVASHLRALYATDTRDPNAVRFWSRNAVNCTAQLRETRGETIFFASDSAFATAVALRYGASSGLNVAAQSLQHEPVHLDKAANWRQLPPSHFYESFVDLNLLANSRCVAYGMGGYGKFASWLSANQSCSMQHHAAVGVTKCSLPTRRLPPSEPLPGEKAIFLPPMPGADSRPMEPQRHASNPISTNMDVRDRPFPDPARHPPLDNLWEGSNVLPQWMKDYFAFHRAQRWQLSKDNWQSFKFLIADCVESAAHCGGTADRLRPIPFLVRLAAETNRILLVHWGKPKPLESFLLPPVGGIDWRTPDWLAKELGPQGFSAVNKIVPRAQSNRTIVQARIQAHDHGSKYYNAQANETNEGDDAFRRHYHDCWYVLFTPVPNIAELVEKELEQLQLVPGEFAFAHLRAYYGVESRGRDKVLVQNWTKNALNCLSGLSPGGPYFFSSDSAYARNVAVEYGKAKKTRVVARVDAKPPLHLDLVEDWKSRNASDFYDVFVDLYIMAMGRCMTYNMGGFSKWAQLLSGRNLTCSVRHWTKGVNKASADKAGCHWTDSRNDAEGVPANFGKPLFLPPMDGR